MSEYFDPLKHVKIRTVKEAQEVIGRRVLWDELNVSSNNGKYITVASGTLTEVGDLGDVCIGNAWMNPRMMWGFRAELAQPALVPAL